MPIYEYRCERGHSFEVTQRMTDDPVSSCAECGTTVQRVFHPVAVHFKGSGFYNTDYGKRKSGAASKSGEAESGGASKGESKSDAGSSAAGTSQPDS